MSVKDSNKIIICSSALTGEVFFKLDYYDFINSVVGEQFLYYKISEYINNEEGVIIKIGYKS